jgi:hypothetical protein
MKNNYLIFDRSAKGWMALGALVLFLAFSLLTLPAESARAAEYGRGLGSPDTKIIYTGEQLQAITSAYGEEGRAAYIHARFTFDLAFPFVYGLFFLLANSYLLGKTTAKGTGWRLLNLLPCLAVIFDLAENITVSAVMASFPTLNPVAVVLAQIFTPLKWLFVASSMALTILLILMWVYKRFFTREKDLNKTL